MANADDAAARAAQLGATVLQPPFDVFDSGRMAVVQDPTGARFCIWQAKASQGIGIAGENGALCWADLITADVARAREFYSGLFGWQLEPEASGYLLIKNGEAHIGGLAS